MNSIELRISSPLPRKNVLLDSNLLLLAVVGSYNSALIGRFKRIADYSLMDYTILEDLLLNFRNLIATPHILTEVSNLANSLPAHIKPGWFDHFSTLIVRIEERQLPAADLVSLAEFALFGLTDAALTRIAEDTVVVTADDRLCRHLQRRQLFAISFEEVRASYLYGR